MLKPQHAMIKFFDKNKILHYNLENLDASTCFPVSHVVSLLETMNQENYLLSPVHKLYERFDCQLAGFTISQFYNKSEEDALRILAHDKIGCSLQNISNKVHHINFRNGDSTSSRIEGRIYVQSINDLSRSTLKIRSKNIKRNRNKKICLLIKGNLWEMERFLISANTCVDDKGIMGFCCAQIKDVVKVYKIYLKNIYYRRFFRIKLREDKIKKENKNISKWKRSL